MRVKGFYDRGPNARCAIVVVIVDVCLPSPEPLLRGFGNDRLHTRIECWPALIARRSTTTTEVWLTSVNRADRPARPIQRALRKNHHNLTDRPNDSLGLGVVFILHHGSDSNWLPAYHSVAVPLSPCPSTSYSTTAFGFFRGNQWDPYPKPNQRETRIFKFISRINCAVRTPPWEGWDQLGPEWAGSVRKGEGHYEPERTGRTDEQVWGRLRVMC